MKTVTVNSENKDDAYIATVLLFQNVQSMSAAKVGSWRLGEVYTNNNDQHFITEYTNGRMRIRAESVEGNHTYTFGPEV